MIDEIYKLSELSPENLNVIHKVFSSIYEQAVGIEYVSSVPTEVPYGKLVVYDNGAGTKRLYVKTGKGNIGYITLT